MRHYYAIRFGQYGKSFAAYGPIGLILKFQTRKARDQWTAGGPAYESDPWFRQGCTSEQVRRWKDVPVFDSDPYEQ